METNLREVWGSSHWYFALRTNQTAAKLSLVSTKRRFAMKGLTMVVLAAVALLAVAATGMLRSRSNNSDVAMADMPTLQEFKSTAGAKAPVKEFERPIIGIPP